MQLLWLVLPLILTIAAFPSTRAAASSDKALCLPTNWNYAWSKVGNVWFTRTRDKGEFYTMAEKCANIDPGRSAIASIRSPEEQKNVITDLPDENWWLGGVRIGGRKWYWAGIMKDKVTIAPVTWKYWDKGEPNNHGHEYCMHMYDKAVQRKWNDINCFGNHFRAICEIRCKDGNLPPILQKGSSATKETKTSEKEEESDGHHDYDDDHYHYDDDDSIVPRRSRNSRGRRKRKVDISEQK